MNRSLVKYPINKLKNDNRHNGKAKPKGSANRGTTSLFFDWKRNRYYEEIEGKQRFAFEHEKGENLLLPNDFKLPINEKFDDQEGDLF
jgi:hypothetical protein